MLDDTKGYWEVENRGQTIQWQSGKTARGQNKALHRQLKFEQHETSHT